MHTWLKHSEKSVREGCCGWLPGIPLAPLLFRLGVPFLRCLPPLLSPLATCTTQPRQSDSALHAILPNSVSVMGESVSRSSRLPIPFVSCSPLLVHGPAQHHRCPDAPDTSQELSNLDTNDPNPVRCHPAERDMRAATQALLRLWASCVETTQQVVALLLRSDCRIPHLARPHRFEGQREDTRHLGRLAEPARAPFVEYAACGVSLLTLASTCVAGYPCRATWQYKAMTLMFVTT